MIFSTETTTTGLTYGDSRQNITTFAGRSVNLLHLNEVKIKTASHDQDANILDLAEDKQTNLVP